MSASCFLDVEDDVRAIVVPAPAALAPLALKRVAETFLLMLQRVRNMHMRHVRQVRPVEVCCAG